MSVESVFWLPTAKDEKHQTSQSSAKSNEDSKHASEFDVETNASANASNRDSEDRLQISDIQKRRLLQNRNAQLRYRKYCIII